VHQGRRVRKRSVVGFQIQHHSPVTRTHCKSPGRLSSDMPFALAYGLLLEPSNAMPVRTEYHPAALRSQSFGEMRWSWENGERVYGDDEPSNLHQWRCNLRQFYGKTSPGKGPKPA